MSDGQWRILILGCVPVDGDAGRTRFIASDQLCDFRDEPVQVLAELVTFFIGRAEFMRAPKFFQTLGRLECLERAERNKGSFELVRRLFQADGIPSGNRLPNVGTHSRSVFKQHRAHLLEEITISVQTLQRGRFVKDEGRDTWRANGFRNATRLGHRERLALIFVHVGRQTSFAIAFDRKSGHRDDRKVFTARFHDRAHTSTDLTVRTNRFVKTTDFPPLVSEFELGLYHRVYGPKERQVEPPKPAYATEVQPRKIIGNLGRPTEMSAFGS